MAKEISASQCKGSSNLREYPVEANHNAYLCSSNLYCVKWGIARVKILFFSIKEVELPITMQEPRWANYECGIIQPSLASFCEADYQIKCVVFTKSRKTLNRPGFRDVFG
jgi:hypothetical protein